MQKRPLPSYQYAHEAQKQLDAVMPSRSGSNEERVLSRTYQTACREMGYEGIRHIEASGVYLRIQLVSAPA
jgi:hypothetical protein